VKEKQSHDGGDIGTTSARSQAGAEKKRHKPGKSFANKEIFFTKKKKCHLTGKATLQHRQLGRVPPT